MRFWEDRRTHGTCPLKAKHGSGQKGMYDSLHHRNLRVRADSGIQSTSARHKKERISLVGEMGVCAGHQADRDTLLEFLKFNSSKTCCASLKVTVLAWTLLLFCLLSVYV